MSDLTPPTVPPPSRSQPLMLPPMRPTLAARLHKLAMNPALHMALPVGALAYLRLTTGKWPTVDEWIAGGVLLVSRFQALTDMIQKSVGGEPPSPSPDESNDAEPPPPEAAT